MAAKTGKQQKSPGRGLRETIKSRDTYSMIFDNVNDAILLRDRKTMEILVNSKFCQMTGYTATEIKKMPRGWFSTSPVQEGRTLEDHYARAANGDPQPFEWECKKKDGTVFWVEANVRKVTIGNREYLLSVLRDITRRMQNREELRQSQARYRSIVEDQTEFLVCHFLADGTVTFVNEALCRCLGVGKEELLGQTFWPFIAKEDVERLRTDLATITADDPPGSIEHRVVARDGRLRCLVWSGKALFDGQEVPEFQAIGRDITERKEAVQAVKESGKTLRALFDAITEIVLLLDVNRIVLALNQALASVIGKEPQEIVGTCIDDYFDPEVMMRRKPYEDSVFRTGKPARFDSERAGKYFEHCVYPVFDDEGKVARLAVFARDVTIQRQAQQEVEEKSRYLEEMNAALKVLLNQRNVDKKELEDKVVSSVRELILPTLRRLRGCKLNDEAGAFIDVLETNLNELISPFQTHLGVYRFTPRELEIIGLIREGRTAKEIARALNVCKGAVDIHRHHIRKKLGITTVKTSLRSHLMSFAPH